MSEYTHTGLKLMGIHEPESSTDEVSPGQYTTRELPGFYTIGTEVDGVFVPLVRLKAGKLLGDIERAKENGYTPTQETEQIARVPSDDLDALYARLAAVEAAQASSEPSESGTPPQGEHTPSG